MVRAPCCEKMGLKKGPWTPEEDQILINYIQLYGHGNWRALPKQAGLLRCGKSCRLRWTNYLRPDIKRGNFTREEEDTIIKLHEMLGNRWSAIAARLPGRTDNEIKNVWHTHLKKRLKQNHQEKLQRSSVDISKIHQKPTANHQESADSLTTPMNSQATDYRPISRQQCSSDTSSVITFGTDHNVDSIKFESSDDFSEILDDNFWSEVLSADNSSTNDDFPVVGPSPQINFPFSPLLKSMEPVDTNNSKEFDESMECFWYNLFTRAGDLPELPEI